MPAVSQELMTQHLWYSAAGKYADSLWKGMQSLRERRYSVRGSVCKAWLPGRSAVALSLVAGCKSADLSKVMACCFRMMGPSVVA